MRDRIAEDHLALRIDAPGSVERNIAVEAQISQVVDLVEGASGRNKYLDAAAAERLDGLCGRRGNSVCLKTDECAVDVEKIVFIFLDSIITIELSRLTCKNRAANAGYSDRVFFTGMS